ncbi:MAG: hypothetical protein A2599_02105 [Candidatus Staskawiczbacteria bacterium RIFOXYD1_FULL_39_28]|uniref:Uncharacterized protein n=1 Tax=Candidatus Staskawiczbacteria bacterium RIFOXYC1_FULL_38_18 TaxID=1802229 RepID=A0A1G2JB98_9BACT|nr:MAG: hypothetical protein A2401_02745 [Candidatus Staskawiczbacteria bacterium RIFOXYC1_FULL_38_18]OGZ91822.1 MAG: hypothetical protein A2599_02105 [Candidatus Staskawiczbacteria bacterium RIFOXYD1_FULL_39_28]
MSEASQIITDSKNIYLIPSKGQEATCSALALFYTLKQQGKNVNLVLETLPENLKFLSPSLDFVSYPKNFVISIPNKVAGVSQIYYEKNDDALKIFLTLEKGAIKKDNISFYYQEAKPDLIITIGVKDYAEELKNLDSFGFLMESPILNIDNDKTNNKNFGKINLVEEKSLAETIFNLSDNISKESAKCLLAGLVIYTENFQKNMTAEVFEKAGLLMKKGVDLSEITKNVKIA